MFHKSILFSIHLALLPICSSAACRSREFSCGNDKCIPLSWRCDKEDDCGDNSDEQNCDPNGCPFGEFSCSNKKCIPAKWRCDREDDCGDGSDEEKCASAIMRECDKDTEFECGNNTCIPIELVCNKENDCGESEDEPSDKCFVNECLLNNGGCPQLCVDDNYGFHCECHDGYKVDGNGSCIISVGRGSLLYKNGSDLLMLDIETREKKTIFSGLGKPMALDYDFENGVILWGDLTNKSIHRLSIQNGTSSPITANDSDADSVVIDKVSSEGIAVDWVHGNVYWTDSTEKSINVATLDGNLTRVLFNNNITKPRAIVVNPLEGWLFWTDWGWNPKIERAGMDGTHRSIIVSENITWPNGLAIDYETRRIFWTDGKRHTLSSSDYDGSNVKVLFYSSTQLRYAFAIDVFQDSLYWNEWKTKKIRRINAFTGENVEIIASEIQFPAGLKVYHPFKQPKGINYCINTNSSCSHFCLPAPQVTEESSKFTCFCPDGMLLADDKICRIVE